MIKIFNAKNQAKEFADKIHEYLKGNCPNYLATKWQDPSVNKEGTLWYIQVPLEYDVEVKELKTLYSVKELITVTTKPQADRATATEEKIPVNWVAVVALP